MNEPPELSVICAVQDATGNIPAILQAITADDYPQVEFLFVCEPGDRQTPALLPDCPNVRCLQATSDCLIPQLWRDGIRAAGAEKVAITTAHCVPDPHWVAQCLALDLTDTVGVGGVIDNDPMADGRGWAVFFLRYIAFASPQTAREMHEIAADNAVYRRADIIAHDDLLEQGFWEPGFHHRFRAAGLVLRMEPALRVLHYNRYSVSRFFAQRVAHGRNFGLARAQPFTTGRRLLYFLGSPLLPLVFLRKIVGNVKQHGAHGRHLSAALPSLMIFLTAWGIGEALGYLQALLGKKDV